MKCDKVTKVTVNSYTRVCIYVYSYVFRLYFHDALYI